MTAPAQTQTSTTTIGVKISLQKGTNGYGFNIIGGIDQPHLPNDSGIFISKISRKGAACKNGQLAVGDKLLSVNGESCEGATHQATLEMFHKAEQKVDLVVQPHAEAYLRQQYQANLNQS